MRMGFPSQSEKENEGMKQSLEVTIEPDKIKTLKQYIKKAGKLAIAYSGGVDSTVLVRMAIDVLGSTNVLALMAVSPLWSQEEREQAIAAARAFGVEPLLFNAPDIAQEAFAAHLTQRCYFCKSDIFTQLISVARKHGFTHIADGTNKDDLGEIRPGLRALRELNISSPLAETGFTKREVRALAKAYALPNWDAPARACLATRIPFGTPVTKNRLAKAAAAERVLFALGIRHFRCRLHEEMICIEVTEDDFPVILKQRDTILTEMEKAGIRYVALDLKGLS